MHARRLHAAGLLDDDELAEAESRLAEIATGGGIEPEDEDVHSAIERLLGEVGRKIHAGRSRNDQVAAAFRLYVADAAGEARAAIAGLAGALLDRAEAEAETPMPGYTHLQRAQPVTVGHHLLAWVEMLERDLDPFRSGRRGARSRARSAPVRSPARRLPLPAPGEPAPQLARRGRRPRLRARLPLRGRRLLRPPLPDRRGARALDDAEFGFARLGEDAATGSSMMPQKLNPDVAELARGKAGTAIGRLTGLLATVKGLPLAYNRDLQEDKAPVFAARADLAGALAALTALVRGLELDRERLAAAASRSAPARHRRRRGARPRGNAVPRRARAGRGVGAGRQLRAPAGRRRGLRPGRAASRLRSPQPALGSTPCDAAAPGGVHTA